MTTKAVEYIHSLVLFIFSIILLLIETLRKIYDDYIKKVELSDKERFWNIFPKYCYEMSAYYDMNLDFNGNYDYEYFDIYFKEDNRIVNFIFDNEIKKGDVLKCQKIKDLL